MYPLHILRSKLYTYHFSLSPPRASISASPEVQIDGHKNVSPHTFCRARLVRHCSATRPAQTQERSPKTTFGPEYDRVVKQHGVTSRAEAVLAEREKRVEKFSIHALLAGDRERYADEWAGVQRRFVDDPSMAVTEADKLVTRVMTARGYPMGDFEQRAADVSVSYPGVVQNYRSAREVVVDHSNGQSTTEGLRQAMVYFRSLFDELLDSPKPETIGVTP